LKRYELDDYQAASRTQLGALCRSNFSAFVRTFWHLVDPAPLVWGWAIQAVCDHLQKVTLGEFRNLIICIPPGHGKSTIVSVLWPAWEWLRKAGERTLFGSYDEGLTLRDAGRCLDLIESDEYRQICQPDWQLSKKHSSLHFFTNTAHGSRKCFFMGSRKKTGWRGNKVVIDDPLSAEDRYDKKVKRDLIDTFDTVLSTRTNDANSSFVIIMQRLADDDLVGFIMEKYKDKYTYLILPTEFDPDRRTTTPYFSDPRQKPGELLFPALFPSGRIDELKIALGPVDYAAQHQHQPFLSAGNRFKSALFQHWESATRSSIIRLLHRNGEAEHVRIDLLNKIMTCDLACTEDKMADFTSIGLWALTNKNELILLSRVKVQKEEPGVIDELVSMFEARIYGDIPPSCIVIESNGFGKPIGQNARFLRNLPVIEVPINKDKIVMSASAIIRIEGGQMFFPAYKEAPWMSEFARELLSFPTAAHDDDVSMVSLAAHAMFEISPQTIRGHSRVDTNQARSVLKIRADVGRRKLFGRT
jgi:predicted phage terminase large subunit-like protein